jgi:hypothetical protein
MPSHRRTTRRRHTRRHRGGAVKFDVKQLPNGMWAITINGMDMSHKAGPYATEKEARDTIIEVQGLQGLIDFKNEMQAVDALMNLKKGGRRHHRGGAFKIAKKGSKWYIYEDEEDEEDEEEKMPFDSFAAAKAYVDGLKNPFKSAAEVKEQSETKSAASVLTQMKVSDMEKEAEARVKKGGRKTRRRRH